MEKERGKNYIVFVNSVTNRQDRIRQFLETKKEIDIFNEVLYKMNFSDEIKKEIFAQYLKLKKVQDFKPCNHEIWIYSGSYCLDKEHDCGKKDLYLGYDEDDNNFHHNEYTCLECGKKEEISNWKDFEEKEFILKNKDNINPEKYMQLYYQLLCERKPCIAQRIVVDEFNKNKRKQKKKIRK